MKSIFIFLGFIFFLSILTFADLNANDNNNSYDKVTGYWAYGCSLDVDYAGYIDVKNQERAVINIADNQIYIVARLEVSDTNTNQYNLYYVSSDVGRGGINISWDEVSKSELIGIIKLIDEAKKLVFEWKGLTNSVNGEKIELPMYSFTFSNSVKSITLKKCTEEP